MNLLHDTSHGVDRCNIYQLIFKQTIDSSKILYNNNPTLEIVFLLFIHTFFCLFFAFPLYCELLPSFRTKNMIFENGRPLKQQQKRSTFELNVPHLNSL